MSPAKTSPETALIQDEALAKRAVNAIRALTIDATQEAGEGHPGMPMGAAPMAYVLWQHFLKHDPREPKWLNRDRFVQSAGHGSMLLYSLLHLTGYGDMTMEELKGYRQWGSKTPGHPEVHYAPGIETTTGPLGQGLANAVGMALAEAHLAASYNKPEFEIFDRYTFVIASDGDLMEGVSSEASSLAGHLGLGKLVVLYDDNSITIDGSTEIAFTEDTVKRYEAYGWHTQRVADGNDLTALHAALGEAVRHTSRPSLIAVRTIIGYGAPNKQGTAKIHGSAMGDEEARLAKENLGVDWPRFTVPDDALAHYREALERGGQAREAWQETFDRYKREHPDLARQLERANAGELPEGLEGDLPSFDKSKRLATRQASGEMLNHLSSRVPELIGGSADLAGSNNTTMEGVPFIENGDYRGRNIHFGVREHAMAAMMNGVALTGGLRPYGGTFLIFSDYLRPSLRLAALMELPVVYVLTHDSIGLGGDGPTHQPVEQLMSLRMVPNLVVIRPADASETAQAWLEALRHRDGPTALALSRQGLPVLDVPGGSVARGAYVLADADGEPELILIGTGSEVSLCLEAQEVLAGEGVRTRVVSMPSWELFERQDEGYRETVLPSAVRARVAVEAGVPVGWERYTGHGGAVVGLTRFGASAPGDEVMDKLGFNVDNIVATARGVLGR
jgi:transketolase